MKKLFRVKGHVVISRYMIDENKYEDFDFLVEAENEGLAQILIYQKYEKEDSAYDVSHFVHISDVKEAIISGEVEAEFLKKYDYLLKGY